MAHNGSANGVQITEAIFVDGVLKPVEQLKLHEQERVRIFIQPVGQSSVADREAAFAELVAGIEQMNFRSSRPYPTRDELHDRG